MIAASFMPLSGSLFKRPMNCFNGGIFLTRVRAAICQISHLRRMCAFFSLVLYASMIRPNPNGVIFQNWSGDKPQMVD